MKYMFDDWCRFEGQLRGNQAFLFLDYDGTLVPIVESPERAILSPEVRGLMKALLDTTRCKLAVVSGRALEQVRVLVGLKAATYVGNHGLEIDGPNMRFDSGLSKSVRETLDATRADLEERLAGMAGVHVEDKGWTLTVHYRRADPRDEERTRRIFSDVTGPDLLRGQIRVCSGKKVLEVRPPIDWDKGKAVTWILNRWRSQAGADCPLTIYVGDDVTDEDAFVALGDTGVSVLVGTSDESRAKYCVHGPEDVKELLSRILKILRGNMVHEAEFAS